MNTILGVLFIVFCLLFLMAICGEGNSSGGNQPTNVDYDEMDKIFKKIQNSRK